MRDDLTVLLLFVPDCMCLEAMDLTLTTIYMALVNSSGMKLAYFCTFITT